MLEPNFRPWITVINGCCRDGRHKEAFWYFIHNVQWSFDSRNDYRIFADVLKSCAALSAIHFGRAVHSFVVKLGHLTCQAVSKSLLNMYAKCGDLDNCQKLFRQTDGSDPVVWNIVLSGFAGSRLYDFEVMRLFNAMHAAYEPKPNPISFAIILPVCARFGDLAAGRSVHSYIIKSGFETHTLVGNALLSMYAKCGLVSDDAYTAFNSIREKDVVSWNALIAGFSENKLTGDAFRLFKSMMKGPIKPNYATIASILPVCASLEKNVSCHFGSQIHCYIMRRNELGSDISVCNALVSFYLRVGRMDEAALMFRRMNSKDLVSWNAIIAGYASNCEWFKALEFFHELVCAEKIAPDSVTLVSVLPACAQVKSLLVGKVLHGYILRHPWMCEDTAVWNAIVNFYAKCCDVEAAYRTFLMISVKDLISWNSMLDTFQESGYRTHFLDLLHWMLKEEIEPDSITILTIIRFCADIPNMMKVKETHSYSVKIGLLQENIEPTVGNALLDAYAKCGNMEYALNVFHILSDKRNLVTFNSIISGYVNDRNYSDAQLIFDKMSGTDLTTWNLMVRAYAENCFPDEAVGLLHDLQAQGMKPDAVTILSFLPVCSQVASVHLLRQCHAYVTKAGFDDVRLKGALLDVYAKCGGIDSANKLFQLDPHKDLLMFTAMIGGYAMHGMGKEALRVFFDMLELGVKPDDIIITSILSACSHAGLVEEGLKIFYSIQKVHGMNITMEQYSCLVDILARGGWIFDAYSVVSGMPVRANANVWGTLLGACRTHHEVGLGRLVADHLFEVESNNIGNYVLMSNLYAADARWDGVMEMRKLIRTRDLKKSAGCSWIEVEKRNNVFIAGDSSHPQRNIIYSTLNTLDQQIKEPLHVE